MIVSKYKLENGNYVIVFTGDSEDEANEGIAPNQVVSSQYFKDADLGVLVVSKEIEISFDDAVRPAIKWISENHHPHTKIIIDSTSAELFEGLKNYLTDEFLKD